MSDTMSIEQVLDKTIEQAIDDSAVQELQLALDMRLKAAQVRYYSAVADAMEAPAETEAEQAEAADKYAEYIRKKKRFRETKSPESKQALSASLQGYLADVFERLSDIYRDSDCQEEREQARNFAKRLREVFP